MLLNEDQINNDELPNKQVAPETSAYVEPTNAKERNEFTIASPVDSEYQALDIPSSLKFLALFDPYIRTQQFLLHNWQVEVNEDISYGRTRLADGTITREYKPDSIHPYKFALCAANGSGKDAFVIAPFALWFICCKIKAKVIITSSSGTQLSTQTEHYIATLAREVNAWCVQHIGYEILKVRKRHIYCVRSGSVIHMFATDEGEKAEGHHPTAPGCEMAILVNEAKSVSVEIFNALRRCTGYNYWINISSPGEPQGPFYKSYINWPNRRRISYFDCPHQSPDEFEEDRRELGEHSALFRSKWLALFTFVGGRYVVDHQKLEELKDKIRRDRIPLLKQNLAYRIGLDIALSTDGDESVISVWKGNKQTHQFTYRIKDGTLLAAAIERDLLTNVRIPVNHPYIFADDGGLGRPVIDILNRRGFRINRVLNNSASKSKKLYKNRGAQNWYKFARLVERGILILKDDDRLHNQIASRKYKETDAGIDKMTLEPKKDMIAEGYPSPDRADAAVLAFTDLDLKDFLDEIDNAEAAPITMLTPQQMIEDLKQSFRRGKNNQQEVNRQSRGKARGSLQVLLQRDNRKLLGI